MENKVTKLVLLASIARHVSDCAIGSFIPTFFLRQYPGFKGQYAFLNALILTLCGFASNLLAGIIGDRFEKKNYMTKGYITSLGSLLPVPFIVLALLGHGSFWLSMSCIAAFVLLSGGYHATAVTMIENVAKDSSENERMIGAWNLYTNICHSLSPIVFGAMATYWNAKSNPIIYGRLLIGFVVAGYLPAGLLFWRSGQRYKELMEERNREAEKS